MKTQVIVHEGDWYSWNEDCDRCGENIHGLEWRTSREPDMNEEDLCIPCLRIELSKSR